MEAQLERIVDNTRAKENINIVVSDNVNPVETVFKSPIILKPEQNYEIALLGLDTFYTFPNITADKNNSLKYRKIGTKWIELHIPTGSYEIGRIREEIIRETGSKDKIILRSNPSTLKCQLVIAKDYEVSFDVENSIAETLGFKKQLYPAGEHDGEEIVNILQINSILVHVNIVKNSYIKGSIEQVIYNFFQTFHQDQKL